MDEMTKLIQLEDELEDLKAEIDDTPDSCEAELEFLISEYSLKQTEISVLKHPERKKQYENWYNEKHNTDWN